MIIKNGLKVYHGSYIKVENPDLKMCKAGKDFGVGFYVTTDIEQARRFVRLAVFKAQKNGEIAEEVSSGYVSTFEITGVDRLSCFEFTSADNEWLHCVAAHRKQMLLPMESEKWKNYDVIAGKIANDNTNRVITAYINEIYGKVGSEPADSFAISLLMPEKLTDQICFRTEKAMKSLKFIDFEEVVL